MKLLFAAAALIAAPTMAQDHSGHAPAPAAAPGATAKLTVDSTIEAIAANPKGKAVLEAQFPGMMAHESYPMFKGMSLKQVQPYANGRITDADVAKVAAELGKL